MNQLTTTSNAIVTGAQWNPSWALTKPTPTTITECKTSRFYDFTFWLTHKQEKAITQKWAELAERIDVLAIELVEQLRNNPHTFYDQIATNQEMYDNLEAVALYAARPDDRHSENCLTTYELSNLLQFRSACTRWGRDQVNVHLLKTQNGYWNQKAINVFLSTVENLHRSPDWKDGNSPYDATTIPWYLPAHQLMFMTVPPPRGTTVTIFTRINKLMNGFTYAIDGNEKRRFIVTPELLDGFLDKIYPNNPSSSLPLIGDAKAEDFTNFYKRPMSIPCSFTPPPEIADGEKVTCAEDFHVHDMYHVVIDKANPHLAAFQELLNKGIINSLPYARETQNGKIISPFDHYLDREHSNNILESHLAKDTQFWMSLISVFRLYNYFLMKYFERELKPLEENSKIGIRTVIDYIHSNKARWEKDYGINFSSLKTLCCDEKCTKGNKIQINITNIDILKQMKEIASKY